MRLKLSLSVIGALFALCIALVLSPASRAQSAPNLSYLDATRASIGEGSPENALQVLAQREGTALGDRRLAQSLGQACRAFLETGNPAAARAHCLRAIELDGSRGRWRYYNNLGIADFQLGDDTAARTAFESAVVLSGVVYTPRKNLEALDRLEEGVSREQVAARLQCR